MGKLGLYLILHFGQFGPKDIQIGPGLVHLPELSRIPLCGMPHVLEVLDTLAHRLVVFELIGFLSSRHIILSSMVGKHSKEARILGAPWPHCVWLVCVTPCD